MSFLTLATFLATSHSYLNLRGIAGSCDFFTISQNAHNHRIWATNIVARGHYHQETPDVNERRTLHRFLRNYLQGHAPGLGF